MIIKDWGEKIKRIGEWVRHYERELSFALIVIFTAVCAFSLGRLSKIVTTDKPIEIIGAVVVTRQDLLSPKPTTGQGRIVASDQGTAYYLPGCSNRVSDAHRITFLTEAAAQAAGYRKAKNCN